MLRYRHTFPFLVTCFPIIQSILGELKSTLILVCQWHIFYVCGTNVIFPELSLLYSPHQQSLNRNVEWDLRSCYLIQNGRVCMLDNWFVATNVKPNLKEGNCETRKACILCYRINIIHNKSIKLSLVVQRHLTHLFHTSIAFAIWLLATSVMFMCYPCFLM